jgi:hypothetical protein
MALYMSAIVLSMALGGAMPSFIAKAKADAAARAAAAAKSVADYAYCAAMPAANYSALSFLLCLFMLHCFGVVLDYTLLTHSRSCAHNALLQNPKNHSRARPRRAAAAARDR